MLHYDFSRFFSKSKNTPGRNLLILNYVLDRNHPALAHQFDVVEALASRFKSVTVLTGAYDGSPCQSNVRVENMNWQRGEPARNIYRLSRSLLKILRRHEFDVVFSHMTLIQSAIFGVVFRLKRVPHFLWYAHAQDSIYLHWVYFISNGIVTSTRGSCPISGAKVHVIGQGIREEIFLNEHKPSVAPNKCVHIGRTDPSKRIEVIIDSVAGARNLYPELTLEIVGGPSSVESANYIEAIKERNCSAIDEGWLKFTDAIKRSDVPDKLKENDIFIHAFVGSLDKSLIEATMAGLSVVTLNREYSSEFPERGLKNGASLNQGLLELLALSPEKRSATNETIQRKAIDNHSFESWIRRLTVILNLEVQGFDNQS